jgi:hypothetical protein
MNAISVVTITPFYLNCPYTNMSVDSPQYNNGWSKLKPRSLLYFKLLTHNMGHIQHTLFSL